MAEIVRYTPEHKDQLLHLLTGLWSPDLAVNAGYFAWKHERNPYLSQPLVYLALHEKRVVATKSFFGGRWQWGGEESALCLTFSDTFVAPEHRNQGLARTLTQQMLRDRRAAGDRFVLISSSQPIMRQVSLALGGQCLGSLESWRKEPFMPQILSENRDFIQIEEHPRPLEMAELVAQRGNDGRIRHVRDQNYYAWRFGNPLARYRFFFWRRELLTGFLVLHTSIKSRHRVGHLVDWEAREECVFAGLLEAAMTTEGMDSLTIWGHTLPENYRALLPRFGFEIRAVEANRVPTILVVPTDPAWPAPEWVVGGRRLRDLADWNLRMIFADNF